MSDADDPVALRAENYRLRKALLAAQLAEEHALACDDCSNAYRALCQIGFALEERAHEMRREVLNTPSAGKAPREP